MEEITNNSANNITEENTDVQVQPAEEKKQSSALDLLTRLNKNIAETPKSGRKYTTQQTETPTDEPETEAVQPAEETAAADSEPAPGEDVHSYVAPENLFADENDGDVKYTGDEPPMMGTFDVPEKVFEKNGGANRREYKVRVANRAKASVIPEKQAPYSEPADMPKFDRGYPAAPIDESEADDIDLGTIEPMATEPSPDEAIPEKVRDRYNGFGTRGGRRQRQKTDDLKSRIEDAEQYMEQMQTGEIPISSGRDNTSADIPKVEGEFDETDMNLMIAFGMDDELKRKVGEKQAEKLTEGIDKSGEELDDKLVETGEASKQKEYFEYTDPEQVKPIFKRYRADYANLLWRILSCAVLIFITFFYENIEIFGAALPPMLNSTSYPVVHTLIGLQLLILGGALIYRQLWDGINSLLAMKPTPESLAAVMMAVSVVYHIVLCFTGVYTGVRLYNFPMMLMIMLALLYEMNSLKQEMFSFNVAASKKAKYTIDRVSDEDSVMEREAFSDMLPESPVMFRIGKVQFVDGFYKRTKYTPQNKKAIGIILPIVGAVALIFFTAGLAVTRSFYGGLQLGYMTMAISVPLSMFVTYSYPFYTASKNAYNTGGAIVGECSLAEYDKASVISFDDVDVFPAGRVKLKTVKTFGNSRIDQVIFDAKCVFVALGGPLADVFTTATEIDVSNGDPVEVLQIYENGIEVMLGSRHLLIGKGDFIRSYQFEPINSREDEGLENSGDVTVMYMVADNEVVAKYYLQYRIDPDFDYMLSQLYKSGMCVGIRTLDPNISDFMLSTRVKISKFAVKVLKYSEPFRTREHYERVESGIISKNSPKSLLMTLALCDKVQHIIRTNLVVTIFSLIISLVIMAFVLTLDLGAGALSLYIALYQAFWIIPMVIISKLFI